MRHIPHLGITRGLIGQIVATIGGIVFVSIIRMLFGYPSFSENIEPAVAFGAVAGVIGFLLAAGVLTDWIAWTRGEDPHIHHGARDGRPEWTRYFSVDVNHKIIGIQYGVTAILVFVIGGILALIFRFELVYPGMQFLTMEQYNTVFSAHGIIMIASILLGVGALINYLVPLQIGAADMAFPRLNAFSFWVAVPSALLIVAGIFVQGWDSGWTAYPPLSVKGPVGTQLFLLGFWINGFSSIAGAINMIVTVAIMRAPGMSLFRMPIFVWAALATAIIQFTATQTVGVALTMVTAERLFGMGFFNPLSGNPALGIPGGDPILFQHIFWFYSHPAVYVFVLPGLGIISELLPVFSRKPLFGYRWIALSSLAIAIVGYFVWAHHMFTALSPNVRLVFMYSTLFVAVPTGVKFFSWIGTLWQGKLEFPTPMLFVLGAISVFLIGGLSGPILGTIPTDLHLHDSYWVVGHFHATMFGGYVFPYFAAIYYWYPKITGRMYNEALGKLHFWLMVPGFWLMSLGQMRAGLVGMRRRIADYDPALGVTVTQTIVTVAALIIAWSMLIMFYNLIVSAWKGEVASTNPWRSRSPEWQTPTPIPEFNYDQPIQVVGNPYDYGLESDPGYIHVMPASGD